MGSLFSRVALPKSAQRRLHQPSSAAMSVPSTTKAVVIKARSEAVIEEVPVPKLRDEWLIVKTTAVGLNPTDWKALDFMAGGDPTGTKLGNDYTGVVVDVGPKVTKGFKKGDKICGVAHGANQTNKEDGAFAEYITVKGDIQIKVPENLSDEQAASLGISITTVGQVLYQGLKIPLPTNPAASPFPILIYGGSTATGLLGIQFAKSSGLTVVTTSSPRNFDYLRSLGADVVLDYHSDTLAADIRAATNGKLAHAWDCFASSETARLCAEVMAPEGGRYASLLPVDPGVVKGINPRIETSLSFAYTILGEEFSKGITWPPIEADWEFGKMWWEVSSKLLESGKIKPVRTVVNQGGRGLEGVLKGLEEMKRGRVSAAKWVYTMP